MFSFSISILTLYRLSLPLGTSLADPEVISTTSLTMLDPKWTGTAVDQREMRTLQLKQVVRVSVPGCVGGSLILTASSATLTNFPCSPSHPPCCAPGKSSLGISPCCVLKKLPTPFSQHLRSRSDQRRHGRPLLELYHCCYRSWLCLLKHC
jgi:hypothetical protein